MGGLYHILFVQVIQVPDLLLEQKLMGEGYRYIGGVDEAGRGPWAGPVSAGCVVVEGEGQMVDGVNDSKKMSDKKREELYDLIISNSSGWGVGMVSAAKIDKIGIQEAVKLAMQTAVDQAEGMLGTKCDYIIADGLGIRLLDDYEMVKIKAGDAKHYSIAAASILAKVTRDRMMKEAAKKYPEYGFDTHVGYGTKAHSEALQKYGVTPIHRRSYKPIAAIINK